MKRMSEELSMWTVYRSPADAPGLYVARRWETARDGIPRATTDVVRHQKLQGVRDQLPAGLYRMERDPNDDPVIVETWI